MNGDESNIRRVYEAAYDELVASCVIENGSAGVEHALKTLQQLRSVLPPDQWASAVSTALTERYDHGGRIPLTAVAHCGAVQSAQLLLEFAESVQQHGAASLVAAKDGNGWNSVHEAAFSGHAEVLTLLLQVAPTLATVPDSQGSTPLHCAAYSGSIECSQALLDTAGALALAQAQQQPGVVLTDVQRAQVLQEGAERLAATKCSQGYTPMHYAALGGHARLVTWFSERCPNAADATATAVNEDGLAPVDMAPSKDSAVAREIDTISMYAQLNNMTL